MINNYENFYILKGSLTEEKAKEEMENIKGYFENVEIYEKSNDRNGYVGKKILAYNIGKETTGYYYITYFKGTYEDSLKIEQKLRLNDNVMKFVTLKID